MSVTVTLHDQEIAAIKQLTRLENDADAITAAAREFLRLTRLRELKSASGHVEMDSNWEEYEQLELASVYTTDPHFDFVPDLKRFRPE